MVSLGADGTIVNVAISSITQHLRLSAADPAWIVNAYVAGGQAAPPGRLECAPGYVAHRP
jgi:hypothetical protein